MAVFFDIFHSVKIYGLFNKVLIFRNVSAVFGVDELHCTFFIN